MQTSETLCQDCDSVQDPEKLHQSNLLLFWFHQFHPLQQNTFPAPKTFTTTWSSYLALDSIWHRVSWMCLMAHLYQWYSCTTGAKELRIGLKNDGLRCIAFRVHIKSVLRGASCLNSLHSPRHLLLIERTINQCILPWKSVWLVQYLHLHCVRQKLQLLGGPAPHQSSLKTQAL